MLFCEKCGTQIDEGSAFCSNCGNAVNLTSTEPAIPVVEEAVLEEVAPQEDIPMDNSSIYNSTPEKKKRRMPIWAKIGIPVIALGLVAVIILNISTIWGTLLKWFGSDETYFHYVQSKAIEEMSESFVKNYYSIKNSDEFKTTVNMGLTVDESISDLIDADEEIFDLINDIEFTTTLNSKSDKIGADLILGLKDKDVLSLEYVIDSGSNSVYFTVPEILDEYLMAELDTSETEFSTDIINKIFEAMPESDDFETLLNDYTTTIFNCVEDVDKDTKTLKIEGIEQNCTTLSFDLTDELAVEMATAVLEKAKDDEILEDTIKKLLKAVDEDASNYDDFSDLIDETLEELEDYDVEDITYAEITEYVDSSHTIIGFEIEVEGESVFYAIINDGTEIATEINIADEISLAGKGNIEDGLLKANLKLKMGDKELAEIKISNYNIDLAQKGLFAGNIKLSILEDGISLLEEAEISEAVSVFKLLNPSIEIDVKRPSDNKCNMQINILGSSNTVLFGLDINTEISDKADSISVPNNAVNIEDDEAMQELSESLDFTEILENLEDAGVSEELLEMLSLLFITPSYSDYSDYSDYTYDDYEDYDEYDYYDNFSDMDDSTTW